MPSKAKKKKTATVVYDQPYLARPDLYQVRASIIGGKNGVTIVLSEYDVDSGHHMGQLDYYRTQGPVREVVILDDPQGGGKAAEDAAATVTPR